MSNERVLVADVMTVHPVVVSVDATLEEADLMMRSTFVIGIPVVDGDGVLVGIIGNAHLAAHRFGRPMSPSNRSPEPGH
jgi:CBS domain-containing protein